MNILKPTSNVVSLTTANVLSNATLVYISASAAAQINVYTAGSTQYASFVLPANQWIFVSKNPTDTLSSNVAVQATPSAYRG
jgi:hypothetical protein